MDENLECDHDILGFHIKLRKPNFVGGFVVRHDWHDAYEVQSTPKAIY
jgi:hypothetical protein